MKNPPSVPNDEDDPQALVIDDVFYLFIDL